MSPNPNHETLSRLAGERILFLDGAMGTMIQRHKLTEEDFRGARFAEHPTPLRGNNDLLVLTRPELIAGIHDAYFAAGSDIVETNSFNAQALSQAEYGLSHLAYELNLAAAQLARKVADGWSARTPERPRFVAGSMGPSNKALSMSPRVDDPGYRDVDFATVRAAYAEQARGLVDGGVDLLILETIFDTLTAKAAIFAILELFEERGRRWPLILSVTVDNKTGRTLPGQTVESFYVSVAHARPFAVGLNCGFGARDMRAHVEVLSRLAPCLISCYPNAGLPNAFGEFDESPESMARALTEFAQDGLCNIVGGCCGTTDAHIRAISEALRAIPPRRPPASDGLSRFAGLETLTLRPDSNFTMIGERTNVTGSRKFARLIKTEDYQAALAVAAEQVEGGANVIDINMDEAMLDSEAAMTRFLRLVAVEPSIARVPLMIDSSRFSVLEAGLMNVQGKAIVNSISLKEGEEEFLVRAKRIRRYGAAVVVMAFDEQGQAETAERKFAICARAYRLLVEQAGFCPEDIIFDPNVFAVATGIEGHNRFGLEFIQATQRIKAELPKARVSGGISNLSFSFRGNEPVREAFHSAFLYHAIRAGLDMGIVNAGQLAIYEEIPKPLLEAVEDVLFDRRPDATERMVALADTVKGTKSERVVDDAWRQQPVHQRIVHAVLSGFMDHIEADCLEAHVQLGQALLVIEGPLMDGMRAVGELFGAGKMFLPQVVKSARVMKRGVAILEPFIQGEQQSGGTRQPTVVLATVKGDVHDIGKNIVGVVLGCNNYRVVDLGVMVPADTILDRAREEKAEVIGLSGLITPSLDEMVTVAKEMKRRGLELPLMIGGATTSRQHTALRIAPEYPHEVVHVLDASRAVGVVASLLEPRSRAELGEQLAREQEELRVMHGREQIVPILPLAEARRLAPALVLDERTNPAPPFLGTEVIEPPLATLVEYIDWTFLFTAWEIKGRYPAVLEHPERGAAARELFANAQRLLAQIVEEKWLTARAVIGFFGVVREGDDVVFEGPNGPVRMPMLRQQQRRGTEQTCRSLADYVRSGSDHLGGFAVTAGLGAAELVRRFEQENDDYSAIMIKALADRLAEAAAEWLHEQVRRRWYVPDEALGQEQLLREEYRGIRPALGYPACPDHTLKGPLFELLGAERIGMGLTESFAMTPAASVSGLYFAHPNAGYFAINKLGRDQVEDYAVRRGWSVGEAERWLSPNLGYQPT